MSFSLHRFYFRISSCWLQSDHFSDHVRSHKLSFELPDSPGKLKTYEITFLAYLIVSYIYVTFTIFVFTIELDTIPLPSYLHPQHTQGQAWE